MSPRRLFAGLFAALLVVGLLGTPTAQSTSGASQQAQASFAQIAGCLAGGDLLKAVLVVDESASLQTTDPENQRTDGLLAALDGLAALQAALPDKRIEVSAATFSDQYRPAVDWGTAEGRHLDQLRSFATDDVPKLNTGTATDYRAAMLGAQRALGTDPACKVMLWFTDGGLDVGDSAEASKAAALQEICQPGGIADSLRSEGVHVEAVALFKSGDTQVTDADRANLAKIAEGSSTTGSCGTVPIPDGYALGAYLSANDPAALSALFAEMLAQISGFTPAGDVECPSDECVAGQLRFPVDPGIGFLRIISATIEGTPNYTITPPAGTPAEIPANGQVQVGPFTGLASTAGRTLQFDLDLRGTDASGEWTLAVLQGKARVGIFLQSSVQVALADTGQRLNGDAATEVPLRLTVAGTGKPVDPDVYGSFDVVGIIDSGTEIPARRNGQDWVIDVPAPPTGDLPSSRLLTVRVNAVTKPSGLTLQPIIRQFEMPVSVSAAYPSILSSELQLSPVAGEGTTSGELLFRGSALGPTSVCATSVTLAGPEGQPDVELQPDRECLDLGADEEGSLTFTAPVNAVSDGSMRGEANVTLNGYRPEDAPVTFTVPARLGIERPIDEGVRWGLVLLLLALSIVLPLLIVYLLGRHLLARFTPLSRTVCRVISVPVTVTYDGEESRLLREGRPIWLTYEDAQRRVPPVPSGAEQWNVPPLKFSTSFEFMGLRKPKGRLFRRVKVPVLSLQPSAVASLTSTGQVLTSPRNPFVRGDGAPSGLSPESEWFLVFNVADLQRLKANEDHEETGTINAQLFLLLPDTSPDDEAERGRSLAREEELPGRMVRAALGMVEAAAAAPVPVVSGGHSVFDDDPFAESPVPYGDDDFGGGPLSAPPPAGPRPAAGPTQPPPGPPKGSVIDDADPDW